MLGILKLSQKGIKRLLSVALVIGIIATYTAYKGRDQVRDIARDTLKAALADMEVQRGDPAGQQIILVYNSALEHPTPESFIKLYSMIDRESGNGDYVVRFPGDQTFPSPEIEAAFAYNVNQLTFVDRPIISGAWIFLVVAIASYVLTIICKAMVSGVRWAIRKG